MKILHTADLHLGSPLSSRLPAEKARLRRRELLGSFGSIAALARKEKCEAVILAGDIFDSAEVSPSTVKEVMAVISGTPETAFLAIEGNHDESIFRPVGTGLPENLILFGKEWGYHRIGNVIFAGRSETKRNMFSSLTLSPEDRNVLILHGDVADHSDEDYKIGIGELRELPVDYVALGHYHSYREYPISARGCAVYAGTPEGRGFDELGEKGVVIVELDGTSHAHRFVKNAKRTLHEITIPTDDITSEYRLDAAIKEATRGIPYSDIVRILLIGEHDMETSFDTDAIRLRHSDAFFHLECRDDSRVRFDIEKIKLDRTLKGEFIRGVLADESLSGSDKQKIIAMGLGALRGDDID
ncbi:MAG: DNA repair exonuclease [Clostridia bacterium]|nr:DNA repair exonuclease [Clostridia bacterium]